MTCAWAQSAPQVGYVYPAGGPQGAVIRVVVGGQGLREPEYAYVSGSGVSAEVIEYVRVLDDDERGRTWQHLRDLVRKRWSIRAIRAAPGRGQDAEPLPDHPWLRDLDEKTPAELARLRLALFDPKRQPNAQIEEQVAIEVTVAADAPPGDRELRLATAAGLSNPLRFQVGRLPEVREEDLGALGDADAPAVDLPVVLNGQIMPGQVDRFRVRAQKGQQLVIHVQARRLVPYLADAVPGWFQATVALYDPHGNEVAYADDYRFDPDPVLCYRVPEDGVYRLDIRDAIYRGREDFVYRITVGELPFITGLFPLSGQANVPTTASVTGWNLPTSKLDLDTRPEGETVRQAGIAGACNAVFYAVDGLPHCFETESNDDADTAQRLTLPRVVNGRIGQPGDVDVFSFDGRAGEDVVVEVWARRLGSPLDSALQILDPQGTVIAENDDHDDPEFGLITHQADSYLRASLPADGVYRVVLVDAQRQGGEEFAYCLRLGPPQPDFALRVTPSSLSMPARRPATLTIRAVRKDGFDGDIGIALKDAPGGFRLSQARIPRDKDSVQATLTCPQDAPYGLSALRLEGYAQIGGVAVTRPAVPAEDMMQAFAYRHLVSQQQLLVAITGSRRVPSVWRPLLAGVEVTGATPVRIPAGGTAQVALTAPRTLPGRQPTDLGAVRFSLSDPPRGIRLTRTTVTPTGVTLTLKADANSTRPGQVGNLIIEATIGQTNDRPSGEPAAPKPRVSLGVLPAIPYEVVRPGPGR